MQPAQENTVLLLYCPLLSKVMPLTTYFLLYCMCMIWKVLLVNGGLVAQAERRNSSCCLPLLIVLQSSSSEFQGKWISPLESEKATSPKGNFGLTKFCGLVVWCLWPFFPQHGSAGGEGFYAGLTFLPTDTQGQCCSCLCCPCRRGCTCCLFSTDTWERIFLWT